ncbi:MAG TPA: biotin--[acetyl-CoA-carboxylase] ligase [Acetobacteraceae bacterium]|nr:biotin--[acetyl-CoA-carboxylase] ligase [Acetobacteraceae bacterium]
MRPGSVPTFAPPSSSSASPPERAATAPPGGWRTIALGTVGSTNLELRRRAYAGAPHRTVVTARAQSAGRGRDGRQWESPEGNLYLSALLRPNLRQSHLPELAFVAALAVADAVDVLLPASAPRTTLKWPNDVLVGGAKIAGILIETAGDAVILGIGLNLVHYPENAPYPTTALAAHGATTTQEAARDTLLDALDTRLSHWELEGFAAIRAGWLARGPQYGTRLRVRHPPLEGSYAGLDTDGALLLDTPQGRKRIITGDVSPA